MLRKIIICAFFVIFSLGLKAQYITEVIEYRPAPGQFINSMPWGSPVSSSSLEGGVNGSLSLGAFGGYVIFRFTDAVENHPDNPFGIDFTVFGNPTLEWSEPGVVWVMKDENENGQPDDIWYELAGSDYYFSSTRREYRVTYFNPGGLEAMDVPWAGPAGDSGIIRANGTHVQTYYPLIDSFPGIPGDEYGLSGTLIQGAVDVEHPPLIKSLRRAFGYADNQVRGSGAHQVPDNPYTFEVENSGGDGFDIGWALDKDGNPVDLDRIHFVKVQNGLMHEGGWLGELSTEITGAVDVSANAGLSGNLDLLVLKDIPAEIHTDSLQMELFLFHMGKPLPLPQIQWTLSEEWASVDEDQVLRFSASGPLTINALVIGNPFLQVSASTLIGPDTISTHTLIDPGITTDPLIYPNPSGGIIRISGLEECNLIFYDLTGKIVRRVENYSTGMEIHIHDLPPGIYLLKAGDGPNTQWLKLLKE